MSDAARNGAMPNGAPRLGGCGTALVTPFTREDAIDENALRALVEWQIEQGIDFLVPCGSTGEAATMTLGEQRRVVEITAEQAIGRVPVVAGAGANDTRRAVLLSREMKAAGATHLLHVTPMYNKPPQRGIVAHFRAIADASELPVIAYNVPGRTGSNMQAETTLEVAELPNIAGVKEASGDLEQILEIIRRRPAHFSVLSGDDALTPPVVAAGGDGVISVVSNAVPAAMTELVWLCSTGDMTAARAIYEPLKPWMEAAFIESNPIPAKAALAMMGRIENVLRLPLVPLDPSHEERVRASLEIAGALPC